MQPAKLTYSSWPFFLALNAIVKPIFEKLLSRTPLWLISNTLMLLHSPNAIQNYFVSFWLSPNTAEQFKTCTLPLILSNFYRDTTNSLI